MRTNNMYFTNYNGIRNDKLKTRIVKHVDSLVELERQFQDLIDSTTSQALSYKQRAIDLQTYSTKLESFS